MTTRLTTIEESLRSEMRSWLCCAIGTLQALPTPMTDRRWERATVERVLTSTRDAVGAVRLYAMECVEIAEQQQLSRSTLRLADFAVQMCQLIEEEVNVVEDELLTYAG